MLTINCTKKLVSLLDISNTLDRQIESKERSIWIWYGNTFQVEYDPYLWNKETETYLLLVNSQSLLSFSVRIPDELTYDLFLEELPQYFKQCLLDARFTKKQTDFFMQSFKQVSFSKNKCQSMTGYLRSLAFDYQDIIRSNSPYENGDSFRCNRGNANQVNNITRKELLKGTPAKTAKYLIQQYV